MKTQILKILAALLAVPFSLSGPAGSEEPRRDTPDEVLEMLRNAEHVPAMPAEFVGRWRIGASCADADATIVHADRVAGPDRQCRFNPIFKLQTRPVVIFTMECVTGGMSSTEREVWIFNPRLIRFVSMNFERHRETIYWRCER